MVGFTIMMAVRSVFIIRLRKTDEEITTSSTAKIENSIIAIILSGETNIQITLGHPGDRKIGGNETQEMMKRLNQYPIKTNGRVGNGSAFLMHISEGNR